MDVAAERPQYGASPSRAPRGAGSMRFFASVGGLAAQRVRFESHAIEVMRFFAIVGGLAAAQGTSLLGSRASAWCQMVSGNIRPTFAEPCVLASNHEGIYPLAWRRRCTSISVSGAMPPRDLTIEQVQAVLREAIQVWTSVDCGGGRRTGLSVDVLVDTNACDRSAHHGDGRNVHSVVFVREGWVAERRHDGRAYAVTYVWHDPGSGEIYDADIEVNEERGRYAICPASGCTDGRLDLPNVLTHEMGHYFGLAHTPDDVLATMHASAPPGETIKRTLADDDIAGICTIYGPGSLPASCDPSPRGGLDLSCAPPGGCGCRVGLRRGAGNSALALSCLAAVLAFARARRAHRSREVAHRIGRRTGRVQHSPTP